MVRMSELNKSVQAKIVQICCLIVDLYFNNK